MVTEMWLTFILAATVILVIPGPTIILVMSQAVMHGRKSVLPLVTGVVAGDLTAMVASLLGLGAVMAASAALFTVFKWAGACYLVYLGLKLWRTQPNGTGESGPDLDMSSRSLLRSAFVVTSLNPKSIAFFVAFFPQFIIPVKPVWPQLAVLGATFLFLAAVNAFMYGIFAGQLRDTIRKERVKRWFNRCGGGALIGAGIITAGLQRSV
jgi:threonine/homoserine/homoserine lactone efflux protein